MDEHPYQKQWESYRKRRKAFYTVLIVVVLIYIPLLLFYFPGIGGPNAQPGPASLAVSLGLLAVVGISTFFALRFNLWKCPKCGKAFHGGLFMNNILSTECSNCDLHKFEGSSFYFGPGGGDK